MARTALACLASLLLAWGCARWLTHDFQVWTSEGARRLDVALNPVAAPATAMQVAGAPPPQTLQHMLAREHAVTIVDFMYTRCTSVCSALGSAFQQLQQRIQQEQAANGQPVPLRLLSISFDAPADDAATLARHARQLQADPRIWRFASVAQQAENAALLRRYQVTVVPDGLGGFEHNAALLVVDAQGRLVRVFDYGELDTALAYARRLAIQGAGS